MEAHIATPTRAGSLNLPTPTGLFGDERLARLTGEGSERAFAALYARFHQPLYRYCYSMLRHEADAQDALQSTFTSALVALRRGQRDAPLRPWLFRIAHNESVSLLRRSRPVSELSETLESPLPSVEATADRREQLAQLVADLQELPERQRGALIMRELNGLSHEELAQALGISVGAAKQTVFEARRALAEFEEGRAMACEEIQRVISDGDRRALRARRVRAHLRECSGCSLFATAIPERRSALLAMAPVLPAGAAAGLFTRMTGASSAHHGGGSLLAGTAGKGIGAAMSTKALVTGVAIVATAAAGTAGFVHAVTAPAHRSSPAGAHSPAAIFHSAASSASSVLSTPVAGGVSRALSAGHGSTGQPSAGSLPGNQGSGHGQGTPPGGGLGGSSGGAGRSAGSPASPGTASAPGQSSSTSGQGASQSNPSTTNSNAHGATAGGTSSASANAASNSHGANPNAGGTNAHGGSVTSHGGNSNAGGTNGGSGSASTNAHGANTNAGGANATTTGSATNAHGANTNAGGAKATINPKARVSNANGGGAHKRA